MDRTFRKEKRHSFAHAPLPLKKSLVAEVEKKFPRVFATNSANRFRAFTDYTLINGLIYYYAHYTHQGEKSPMAARMVRLGSKRSKVKQRLAQCTARKYHAFCIEDVPSHREHDLDRAIGKFLEKYFPQKAPWER